MDELLRIFLTWQFIIFCLGIAGITFVFRKILEYFILNKPNLPGNSNSKIWRELILPITPVILGALVGAFAVQYPYPEGLTFSGFGRVSFGLVAGLLSGLVYRVIVGLLKSRLPPEYTTQNQFVENESTFIKAIRESINKDPVDPTTSFDNTEDSNK